MVEILASQRSRSICAGLKAVSPVVSSCPVRWSVSGRRRYGGVPRPRRAGRRGRGRTGRPTPTHPPRRPAGGRSSPSHGGSVAAATASSTVLPVSASRSPLIANRFPTRESRDRSCRRVRCRRARRSGPGSDGSAHRARVGLVGGPVDQVVFHRRVHVYVAVSQSATDRRAALAEISPWTHASR